MIQKIPTMDCRKRFYYLAFALYLLVISGCSPVLFLSEPYQKEKLGGIYYTHITTDTLFNSKQEIYLLMLPKNRLKDFPVSIGYAKKDLLKTSTMAKNNKAVAAVNGGFFDRDNGGNVCYFEADSQTISRTRPDSLKWAKSRNVANGALVFYGADSLRIEPARSDEYYEKSTSESAVMVAGPLLIKDSKPQPLPNVSLTRDRNPRTCIGITDKFYILAAIDGRSQSASGMTLHELQQFFLRMKCADALNLDGGGSTTTWIKGKGIVNHPSDPEGERQVSDAIIILKK